MLILNDSEGLIQFDGRDSMTGGLTFALLRPGKTSAQLEASFRAMDLKHTIFNEKNTVSASNFGKLFGRNPLPLTLPESHSLSAF